MEQIKKDTLRFGEGWVWHSRPESPSQQFGFFGKLFRRWKLMNSFRYPIFNLLLPVHSKSALSALTRHRLLAVDSQSYLNSENGELHQILQRFLEKEFSYSCDQIWLQTLPSVFGYVFNPVSFWYCVKAGKLDAVLCEVNNTFKDRHFYFLQNLDESMSEKKKALKRFHVSPFMDISGHYTFEFKSLHDGNQVRICLFDDQNQLKLDTIIQLRFEDLDRVSNFYILKKYGWLTVVVVARIHFQALKLWLKGARFYNRPNPPEEKVTHDSTGI